MEGAKTMENCQQKKSAAESEQFIKKRKPKNGPSYHIGIAASRFFDDYLSQIATMRERGNLIISGRRIC
jgi:hypothetical protein